MIGIDGTNAGVLSFRKAKADADEKKLSLVLVNEKAEPPVYKEMTSSQIYSKHKQNKEMLKKQKQKTKPTKQIAFSVKIAEHDALTKMRKIEQFLKKGHSVSMRVNFRRMVRRLNDKTRTPEEVRNDNLVVDEASALLSMLSEKIEGGSELANRSITPRGIKTLIIPLRVN